MGGRPAKSAAVSSGKIGKSEKERRQEAEERVRGAPVKPNPPDGLSEDQRLVFQFIVDELVASGILGKLDVFVLESTAIAVARLRKINGLIDRDDTLLSDTALQGSRAKYQSDLWRGCNELCLSPQARAKIGNLAAQAAREKKDPLREALEDDD